MTESVRVTPNTFNLRSTRAGSGYGQGQHDQGERPAGFLALGWIGGRGRIAVAPFGGAGGVPAWARLAGGGPGGAPGPPPARLYGGRGGVPEGGGWGGGSGGPRRGRPVWVLRCPAGGCLPRPAWAGGAGLAAGTGGCRGPAPRGRGGRVARRAATAGPRPWPRRWPTA